MTSHPQTGSHPPALLVEGLSCRRGGREILHGIDLVVEPGTFVGLLGPNGCGKSTLLRCIAGLERHVLGRVAILGREVRDLPPAELARDLALQAQDTDAALGFSVRDVVGLGRLAHRRSLLQGDERRDRDIVAHAIAALDLDAMADRAVETLSGGERQRVMIARALAQEPAILLLDEPTNHLDVHHRFAVLALVRSLGITVVAALHEVELAARTCDRIVLMHDGRILADDAPAQALTPERLRAAFRVDATLDRHPLTDQIRIDLQPMRGSPPDARR